MAFTRDDLRKIEGMTDAMLDGIMNLHQSSETAHQTAMDALRRENEQLKNNTPSADVMTELDSLRKWKTDREAADQKAAEDQQWSERFGKLTERKWSTEYNRAGILEAFKSEVAKDTGKSDAEIFTEITKGQEDVLFVAERKAFVNPASKTITQGDGTVDDYMRNNARYKNNPWVNKS